MTKRANAALGAVVLTTGVLLTGTANAETWDYGSMYGEVWHDLNADGIHQDDEPGLPDVELRYGSAAGPIAAVSAEEHGLVHTTPVKVNEEHELWVVVPEGFELSPTDVGDDPFHDSDPQPEGNFVAKYQTTPSGTPDMSDPIGVGLISKN